MAAEVAIVLDIRTCGATDKRIFLDGLDLRVCHLCLERRLNLCRSQKRIRIRGKRRYGSSQSHYQEPEAYFPDQHISVLSTTITRRLRQKETACKNNL